MPGVMNTMPQPKEGSRGRCEAEKPPVHGPSGYQPAATRTCTSTAPYSLSSGVRARLAFGGLPDRPPLRCGQPLLVRFAEPGQRHGADDGKAEPKHGYPAKPRPGMISQEQNADHGG